MAAEAPSLLDPDLLDRIKGLSLVARQVVEGVLHGLHKSPLFGLSIEFAQHREYSPGDELKRLDWQVLARSDRYVIKQYEQETNLRAVLLIDASASMAYGRRQSENADGTPASEAQPNAESPERQTAADSRMAASDTGSKFHYARVLAAALSYLLLHQGDSVGLMLARDQIVQQVEPRAAPGHILGICHVLESARPEGRTDLANVLGQLAARLKRRSLVVVISDLLDDTESALTALGQLHHRGHEVVVFQVLDRRELDFDLGMAGRGVTVIRDMETGEEFEAEPALIRALVRDEVRRFLERLDAGARGHGIHLIRCRTDEPIDGVLTAYLHRRMRRH